jgi:hypothetical protein
MRGSRGRGEGRELSVCVCIACVLLGHRGGVTEGTGQCTAHLKRRGEGGRGEECVSVCVCVCVCLCFFVFVCVCA